MPIWLLERFRTIGYDEVEAMVIVAPSPYQARTLASQNSGDEGKDIWLDTHTVSCHLVKDKPKELRLVLKAFNAG